MVPVLSRVGGGGFALLQCQFVARSILAKGGESWQETRSGFTDSFGQRPRRFIALSLIRTRKPNGFRQMVVQEGIPAVIPPEACYLGWQESLVLLAKLVEADIPD
jgi:hypothetical protein